MAYVSLMIPMNHFLFWGGHFNFFSMMCHLHLLPIFLQFIQALCVCINAIRYLSSMGIKIFLTLWFSFDFIYYREISMLREIYQSFPLGLLD